MQIPLCGSTHSPILVAAYQSALLQRLPSLQLVILYHGAIRYITCLVMRSAPVWCLLGHVVLANNGPGSSNARNLLVTPVSGNDPSLRLTSHRSLLSASSVHSAVPAVSNVSASTAWSIHGIRYTSTIVHSPLHHDHRQVNGAFAFFSIGVASTLHAGYSSFRLPYGLLCWLQIAHRIPRFPYLIGFVLDRSATLSRILSF